jgi:FkbM family methyltransferase
MFSYEVYLKAIGAEVAGLSAMEVGVNQPDKSTLGPLSRHGARVILVEPLDLCIENLKAAFPAAEVIPAAVTAMDGTAVLYDRGEGSFLIGVDSPDVVHNKITTPDERFMKTVKAVRMDQIDPGNLDVLHVDTEGAEWFAIRNLVSRPKIIGVETHLAFHAYVNPHLADIEAWMASNGYEVLCRTVADTIWVRA